MNYLFNIFPYPTSFYVLCNISCLPLLSCQTERYKNSFFPHLVSELNKLNPGRSSIDTYPKFRMSLLNQIWPSVTNIFNLRDAKGLKPLTRLHLGLSHLNEHRFNHNCLCCVNPLCSCSLAIESMIHFFCIAITTVLLELAY